MPFKSKPPLYSIWQGMIRRCTKRNFKQWKDYGGRGISVCERWTNGYASFVVDMGPRPDGYTLDRKDNNGNYTPENCRWATRKEQQRNQRVSRIVTIEGRKHLAVELAERCGLKTDTIVQRASIGLNMAEVVSTKRRVFTAGLALGGKANGARQSARTHCKRGHFFDEANTYVMVKPDGSILRQCRRCHTIRERERIKHLHSPANE